MTNLPGGSTVPAVHSLRAFQAVGMPAPSGEDPAVARYAFPGTQHCNPSYHSPLLPNPGSRSWTCAIVRLTKNPPIRSPANHGGLVPRIGPLERLPRSPAAWSHCRIYGYRLSRTSGIGSARIPSLAARRGSALRAICFRLPPSASVSDSAAAGFMARTIFRNASCCAGSSILNMAISSRSSSSRNDPASERRSDVSAPNPAVGPLDRFRSHRLRPRLSAAVPSVRVRVQQTRPVQCAIVHRRGQRLASLPFAHRIRADPDTSPTACCVSPARFRFRLISSPNRASPRRIRSTSHRMISGPSGLTQAPPARIAAQARPAISHVRGITMVDRGRRPFCTSHSRSWAATAGPFRLILSTLARSTAGDPSPARVRPPSRTAEAPALPGIAPRTGRKAELSQPHAGHDQAAASDKAGDPRTCTGSGGSTCARSISSTKALRRFPTLWPEGDGKRLRLYLEAVSEERGMSVWSYTNPIDHAATLMVLLAKAGGRVPRLRSRASSRDPDVAPPAVGDSKGARGPCLATDSLLSASEVGLGVLRTPGLGTAGGSSAASSTRAVSTATPVWTSTPSRWLARHRTSTCARARFRTSSNG